MNFTNFFVFLLAKCPVFQTVRFTGISTTGTYYLEFPGAVAGSFAGAGAGACTVAYKCTNAGTGAVAGAGAGAVQLPVPKLGAWLVCNP